MNTNDGHHHAQSPAGWPPQPQPWAGPPQFPSPMTPGPPKSKGPRRAMLVIAAVAIVGLVTGGVFLVRETGNSGSDGASTPSAPPTTSGPASPQVVVDPTSVAAYLASPDEVSRVAGIRPMVPGPVDKQPYDVVVVSSASCGGAVLPGYKFAYDFSGFSGFAGQTVADEREEYRVIQAIVGYASPQEADAAFDEQVLNWKRCKNYAVTAEVRGAGTVDMTVGVVNENDGTATLLLSPSADAGERTCQRALSVRKNVLVDVRACAQNVGSAADVLARDIGQKITGAR